MPPSSDDPVDEETQEGRSALGMVLGMVFGVLLLLVGNLLVLSAAWQDKSWGALWMAIIGSPGLNIILMVLGLTAIPSLKRRDPEFSLGRHLAVTLGLPIAAVVANFLIILSMDLHGC